MGSTQQTGLHGGLRSGINIDCRSGMTTWALLLERKARNAGLARRHGSDDQRPHRAGRTEPADAERAQADQLLYPADMNIAQEA